MHCWSIHVINLSFYVKSHDQTNSQSRKYKRLVNIYLIFWMKNLPTVQNWPNCGSDATLKPLSNLVTLVLDPTLSTKSMLVDKIWSSKISRSSVYYIINIIDQQFTRVRYILLRNSLFLSKDTKNHQNMIWYINQPFSFDPS